MRSCLCCLALLALAGCGPQDGCFADGSRALEDPSAVPDGWSVSADDALAELEAASPATGRITVDGTEAALSLDLAFEPGTTVLTFPGEASAEDACADWLLRDGTLTVDSDPVAGALPVQARLTPAIEVRGRWLLEEASAVLSGAEAPPDAVELTAALRLVEGRWTGAFQWLLAEDPQGPRWPVAAAPDG